jgi:subtilisin family serine protease
VIRWLTVLSVLAACAGCASAPQTESSLPTNVREHPDSFIVVTVRNDSLPVSARAGSTLRGYDGAAQYSAGAPAQDAVHSLASAYQLREVSGWPISELGVHCVVFQLPTGSTASTMLARLKQDKRVESAQPLNVFATRSTTYNDPYQDLQANITTMGVQAAHQWSRGAGVNVAVIDTGADVAHPDLAGRIVEQQNFVDADTAAFNHDRHGTAVAGVIGADSNNHVGIVGIAPEARLHIYKACWQNDPAGASASCNTFTLAKGLAAAIDARVQIVNLSLAGPEDSLLTRLVVRAQEHGLIFVGAAPQSDNAAAASGQFPTNIKGVLRVAATDAPLVLADELRAPGTDVLTLAPQGRYGLVSGNSLATASVSGAVALLLSRDKNISVDELQQLLAGSTRVADTGVNACAALAALLNKAACAETPSVPVAAE